MHIPCEGSAQKRAGTAFASAPLWKRILDVSLVMMAIPVLLPFLVAIAIFIKASSRGAVLFRQERVGLHGRKFVIYKFRTMIADADTSVHEQYAEKLCNSNEPMTKLDAHGDPRLIPFGRILRASGADELPQMINVLRGDMSLVGPRPCLANEYNRYLPSQLERFGSLPGITGLWQVSGKNRMTFVEMVDCDIEYIRTQSLFLDLTILKKTIPAVMGEIKRARRLTTPTDPIQSTRNHTDGST